MRKAYHNMDMPAQTKIPNWLAAVSVVAITLILYSEIWNWPALSWDDGSNIFSNPYFTMGMWWGVWTEPYFGLYVPVISTIWAALWHLGHGEAWPFHLLNITLHAANTVLVYLILRAVARRWNVTSTWTILLALAIFALHPLQVQAVAWISGGRDLLAAFFALAATLIYFRSRRGYWPATILFALALLSKPSVAILPAVIFVADEWLNPRTWRTSAQRMLPWIALSIAAIVLTQIGQGAHFENTAHWYQRPLLMLDSYRFYLVKTIWPWPLSANYAHTPDQVLGDGLTIFAALILLIGTAVGFMWSLRHDRRFLLAAVWYLLLLPVSGVVPFAYENIGGVADHYNYLPLAAVAILLLIPLKALEHWTFARVLPTLTIAALAVLTWQRLPVWQSDTAFFMDMAKTSPDSYNTAIGMSVVMCEDIKDYTQGVKWADKALAQHPGDILALANEAFCYTRAGRLGMVREMVYVLDTLDRKALKATQPTAYSSLLASLGSAFIDGQEYNDGFQFLCEAYRVLPAEPGHVRNVKAAAEILRAHGVKPVCRPFMDDPTLGSGDPRQLIEELFQPQ